MTPPRVALVLGGGAARGLAHIGALEVLEDEGIEPAVLVGSSMGGLIAALIATGLRAAEIRTLARGFRFPSWFIPGGLIEWERIFRPALPVLEQARFDSLKRWLAVVAVDLESGRRVILRDGDVLSAVRATCAVPAVLPPVEIGGRWLADGALVSVLPVDVASMADPEVVVAVDVGAPRARRLPMLARTGWGIGRMLPNPLTARSSFEILVRAAEIALERQSALAAAMVGPEVLVRVDVGDLGLRDFHRLEEAAAAGRRAMRAAVPMLREALAVRSSSRESPAGREIVLQLDPVCDMVVDRRRAVTTAELDGRTIYFCSSGCRDTFMREAMAVAHGRVVAARLTRGRTPCNPEQVEEEAEHGPSPRPGRR
jgi:NTE family protein